MRRKFVLALLLAALMAAPSSAANRYGLKEPVRDLSYLKANPPQVTIAEDLPASFDLRDMGAVPVAVRQQNPWGTCWAHATMGACETNYLLKVHNGGENFLNATAQDIDLSELHLVYFVYKAPKGYEHMVFSIVNRETELLIRDPAPDDTLGAGATWTQAAALLSRGLGPVTEATLPYTLVNSEGDDGEIDFKEFLSKVQDKGPWDFPSVLRVTGAAYVADANSAEGRERAKQLIRTNGGLFLSYMDSNLGRRGAPYYSYYCPKSVWETDDKAGPHAVLAVGWDDAFPKENFPTGHQPSIDGAWLIRNSWGNDAMDHDGGYFSVGLRTTNPVKLSPIGVELQWTGWSDYSVTYDGESYFSNDGSLWTDGAAMTSTSEEGTTYTPMNACVKAFVRVASAPEKPRAEQGGSIDGMKVSASPEGTVPSGEIEDRNPLVDENSYTGRVIPQFVVDNAGELLLEGTEVELSLVLVNDLHETYPIETSNQGLREKVGDVDGLFPAGYKPAQFYEDEGMLFPVYGPFLAAVDAEGRVTINADNLISEETGERVNVPVGYYDVFYAVVKDSAGAEDVNGWLRPIKVTEAASSSNGSSSGCDAGMTGWLALALLGSVPALLRRR